ncbi:MAG: hypothetical protein D8M58_18345 [Calditrichaeota bacterium]|nr:MAG: hypothetical protein DWQ03_11575 [Calditrichota bacterium]MBL1207371.1 hypothetical protein [Calditrichota bacterium]NOG47203.1 hypothetical protein [Calditrichota bacterium]
MKIQILIILTILLSLLSFAQEPASTNIVWIEKNINSILDSLKIEKSINGSTIEIKLGVVKGEKKGFIKNQVLSYLSKKQSEKKLETFSKFHIEQFNTTIVYEQNSDGFLNLNTYYLRKNKITFSGWIEDSTSKTIKSFNINKVFSNELKIENLEQIEVSPYSFSKGEIKDLSFWTSTLEPILVGGSVAVIVYLFFSVRS